MEEGKFYRIFKMDGNQYFFCVEQDEEGYSGMMLYMDMYGAHEIISQHHIPRDGTLCVIGQVTEEQFKSALRYIVDSIITN